MSVDVETLNKRFEASVDVHLSLVAAIVNIQTVLIDMRGHLTPEAIAATRGSTNAMMMQSKEMLNELQRLIELRRGQ